MMGLRSRFGPITFWSASLPWVALLCLITVGCATLGTHALTLGELIDRHTEARGGQAAIEAIQTLEVKLRIVEPTYTAEGVWRVDREGRMPIDVFIDGQRVFTEAYDGERGWQMPGGEEHAVLASSGGSAALRHSGQMPTNIPGLHEMTGRGHHLFAPREVEGVRFAFQSSERDLATGKLLQTATLLDVRPNAPADEHLFQMP